MIKLNNIVLLSCLIFAVFTPSWAQQVGKSKGELNLSLFEKDNLVAWCIVPFDSKKRKPEERASMLDQLGLKRLAYDWRKEHVATFDEEIQTLKQHGIKLQAFWLYAGGDPEGEGDLKLITEALKRNRAKTEIWVWVNGIEGLDSLNQDEKVKRVAKSVRYIAEEARKVGCKVGLYHYDGWFSEPENQLAVINYLKMPNIGIVYNFHHAQKHLERFPDFFPKILPYLMAINVVGLKQEDDLKLVPVGWGNRELELLKLIASSPYRGPIGIINDGLEQDPEVALKKNLEGLERIKTQLKKSTHRP
ncbi:MULTISPECIES: sugar phosphate isomerase/epimerase family protein [Olivibacter]|uniref:Sugar phosphate isomerase/epimerase family protein n=1 Tax=Olivibacter jilunii TaxID=985016 RepID=A0ABW6AXU3_9SPHI|nr:sugar phosphate isomerase/epimerase [Olivibacter sp. UJ_SKK_5.1]MDX3916579.1 hypothetical protein [Pseudosphingobacterium sp.]